MHVKSKPVRNCASRAQRDLHLHLNVISRREIMKFVLQQLWSSLESILRVFFFWREALLRVIKTLAINFSMSDEFSIPANASGDLISYRVSNLEPYRSKRQKIPERTLQARAYWRKFTSDNTASDSEYFYPLQPPLSTESARIFFSLFLPSREPSESQRKLESAICSRFSYLITPARKTIANLNSL